MRSYRRRSNARPHPAYDYPEGVTGVVWKNLVYHHSEPLMVGETDDKVETSESDVVALEPRRAAKLVKEYQVGYPKPGRSEARAGRR